jgi:hypothetical protein
VGLGGVVALERDLVGEFPVARALRLPRPDVLPLPAAALGAEGMGRPEELLERPWFSREAHEHEVRHRRHREFVEPQTKLFHGPEGRRVGDAARQPLFVELPAVVLATEPLREAARRAAGDGTEAVGADVEEGADSSRAPPEDHLAAQERTGHETSLDRQFAAHGHQVPGGEEAPIDLALKSRVLSQRTKSPRFAPTSKIVSPSAYSIPPAS